MNSLTPRVRSGPRWRTRRSAGGILEPVLQIGRRGTRAQNLPRAGYLKLLPPAFGIGTLPIHAGLPVKAGVPPLAGDLAFFSGGSTGVAGPSTAALPTAPAFVSRGRQWGPVGRHHLAYHRGGMSARPRHCGKRIDPSRRWPFSTRAIMARDTAIAVPLSMCTRRVPFVPRSR